MLPISYLHTRQGKRPLQHLPHEGPFQRVLLESEHHQLSETRGRRLPPPSPSSLPPVDVRRGERNLPDHPKKGALHDSHPPCPRPSSDKLALERAEPVPQRVEQAAEAPDVGSLVQARVAGDVEELGRAVGHGGVHGGLVLGGQGFGAASNAALGRGNAPEVHEDRGAVSTHHHVFGFNISVVSGGGGSERANEVMLELENTLSVVTSFVHLAVAARLVGLAAMTCSNSSHSRVSCTICLCVCLTAAHRLVAKLLS